MIKTIGIAVATLAFSAVAWGQNAAPLSQEDIFRLEAASDPQIAPDGRRIAYVRRSNDIETDQTRNAVWLVEADGSAHARLVPGEGETSNPRWSPDGTRIAFVHTKDDHSTIEVLNLADGSQRSIASLSTGQSGLAWSPDGSHLAWAAFQPGTGPAPASLPRPPGAADWAAAARIEERLSFRFDGAGELPVGSQQLFVVAVDGGEPRQLTDDEAGAGGDFAWSADGQSLVFAADRRADRNTLAPDSELHRVHLADGRIETLTDRDGPDTSPRPSPDGTRLAWLGYDDRRMGYHNVELYVGGPDGENPRSLTADLDRSVSSPRWSRDGRWIYFQYDDHGQTRIARTRADGGGDIEIVTDGLTPPAFGRPYTGGSYSLSDTGAIAATIGSSIRPPDVVLIRADGFRRQLTELNEDALSGVSLSPAEEIRWTSPHDRREIQGWVLYPPGFDPGREWPMILEIHGGPFSAYGPTFSAELQLMAAAGYVVVYTNPRGSTGYGYEFANLIHHDYPGNDYDDLMGAVDFMLARGFIDEDRLFVTGGSGGGVLTAWIVGNTDRFAAAAVVKPVINWTSFVLYSDLPQFFYRYWFASAPWEDPEEYWRRSPLSLVGNVDTPTLVMVGGADLRTPRAEAEQYYSALQLNGVPTRLVVIPDAYHGIANSRPSRLLAKVAEILRWFDAYDPANAGDGAGRRGETLQQ